MYKSISTDLNPVLLVQVEDAVDHEDPPDLLVEAPRDVDDGGHVVADAAVLILEGGGEAVREQEGEGEEVVAGGQHLTRIENRECTRKYKNRDTRSVCSGLFL